MSRETVQRLGLVVLAIAFVGLTEMIVFNDDLFGARYAGERISYMAAMWLGLLGAIAGALVAARLGAARVAMVGLGIAAIGVVLALVGSKTLGSMITPFGVGVFRPCPLGAAAAIVSGQRLGRLRFLALGAASIAGSAATDVSWFLGGYVDERLVPHGTSKGAFVIVMFALAALSIAWAARESRRARTDAVVDAPYRMASPVSDEPPPDSVPPVARTLRGVALLLFPMMVLVNFSYRIEVSFQLRLPGFGASSLSIVRFLVGAGATVYFVRAVRRAVSWSPLRAWAYALVIFGTGLFVAKWATYPSDGVAATTTGLLAALSTPFLWSIASAYAALAVPPRWATAAVAVWMTSVSLVAWPLNVFFSSTGVAPLFLNSIVALGVGLYVARRAGDLHRSLFDPPSPVGTRT